MKDDFKYTLVGIEHTHTHIYIYLFFFIRVALVNLVSTLVLILTKKM